MLPLTLKKKPGDSMIKVNKETKLYKNTTLMQSWYFEEISLKNKCALIWVRNTVSLEDEKQQHFIFHPKIHAVFFFQMER